MTRPLTLVRPQAAGAGSTAVSSTGTADRPVLLKPSYAFIYAKDAEYFSVAGQGAIDGNAAREGFEEIDMG